MHITDGRTDGRIYERKDGHTDIWTNPYCIVIKSVVTIFLLQQYPIIRSIL